MDHNPLSSLLCNLDHAAKSPGGSQKITTSDRQISCLWMLEKARENSNDEPHAPRGTD